MKGKEKLYLVTGGAGFIGSNLIGRINKKDPDIRVVSIDNYFTGRKENHVSNPNNEYLRGDTRDITRIWKDKGYPSPKFVFHLGEYSRIVQSFEDRDILWDYNVAGTKEALEFAQKNEATLVYAGSSSKFGNNGADENLSPYAWVKAKNVELIKNWAEWFGGPRYVITYFYNVYGPGQIDTGKYASLIGIFESKYLNGLPLPVVEPGTQSRDFTHVSDIVNGILICAEKGLGDGYQLGTSREKTILDIAKMFGTEIEMIPARKGERVRGKADPTKARALGWEPRVKIEDYIADFVTSPLAAAGATRERKEKPTSAEKAMVKSQKLLC